MKLKILSRLLAFGVLINSISINSYAGTLSEDGRYETFTGNNITVNDVLEEDKVDMKIEGNTLVNLVEDISTIGSGNPVMINSGNKYTTTTRNDGSAIFKIDTNYDISEENITLVFNYSSTDGIYDNKYLGYYGNNQWANYISKLKKGLNIINYTIPKDGDYNYIWIGEVHRGLSSNVAQTISNLMILEGDYTNKSTPEYFKGIQSSFEDQLITQNMIDSGEEKAENLGKYKVEVKTIGKNLFNINGNVNEYYDIMHVSNKNNVVENNTLIATSLSRHYHGKGQIIKVKPYTDYTISFNLSDFSGCVGLNTPNITNFKDFYIDVGYHEITFNSNNNQYLCIGFETSGLPSDSTRAKFSDIQLEEGNSVTTYKPYKELINTFYLNSPLLEGDTIEYINGQATHVHRYKKIVLDGSEEDWKDWNTEVNIETTRFRIITYDGRSNGIALSDKFRTRKAPSEIHSDTEYIGLIGSNSTLFINILSSKLSSADIDGFKQWLSENPVTVVYELETPMYEPIKADLSVQLFEGTTHISNNSNIPAKMEVTVDRTINRAVEAIELAKTSPTVSNMSLARMWTNLLKETIKKNELQNEINNITEVEGLQLERKTATSNIDVYIKSENMLLMSLSTNNIAFNDYSGVEDMKLNNAINISINSSLPYKLNSYLLSEIENSDKSNRIEKDLLNIKLSKDSDYKTFADINEKLVLEDGCDAGNNKSHSIDLKLKGSQAHEADIYKTVIKFEAEQK